MIQAVNGNLNAGQIGSDVNRSSIGIAFGGGLDLRRRFAECIWEFCTFDWRRGRAAGKMIAAPPAQAAARKATFLDAHIADH